MKSNAERENPDANLLPAILVDAKPGHAVVVGCPLDAATDGYVGLKWEDGSSAIAQCHRLTEKDASGLPWTELSFVSVGKGRATILGSIKPEGEGLIFCDDGLTRLDNGLVRIEISEDPAIAPLRLVRESCGASGTLRPEMVLKPGILLREKGDATRTVRVLRDGAVRAQVEVRGTLAGKDASMAYRLTVELWRGLPSARVDWMLTHIHPGVEEYEVKSATLFGTWDLGEDTVRRFLQTNHSELYRPRLIENPRRVSLVADDVCFEVRVAEPEMLLDDCDYAWYLAAPTVRTGHWLELRASRARVSATVADFAETRPNALVSDNDTLDYHMVPPGQGVKWFQGRRKEQTLVYTLGGVEESALEGEGAKVLSWNRALPCARWLKSLKSIDQHRTLPWVKGRNIRFQEFLNSLCNLTMPAGMWDLGDTRDFHYSGGYAAQPWGYHPLEGVSPLPKKFQTSGKLFPDEAAFFVEPVWINNEYDMIHLLAQESTRTGNTGVMQKLRWAARHNVEVDFVSYSDDKWHHRASPFHSHHHNCKGAISSHFWTQGLLEYYRISGDRDALEVARALGDKIVFLNRSEARVWKFDREIGWALLALVCLVEAGCSEYMEETRSLISFLRGYNRKKFDGRVNLSRGVEGRSLERQIVDNGFGYSSMMEAIDRYVKISGDKETEAWFVELLRDLRDAALESIGEGEIPSIRGMVAMVLSLGFEYTGDDSFLDVGEVMLQRFTDPMLGPDPLGMVLPGEGKSNAMLYRGLAWFLGAMDGAGRLEHYDYPALRKLHLDGRAKP